MAEIIEFPIFDREPDPFTPDMAVRHHLANTKCNAILRARIPEEMKRYLQQQAFASDQTLSRHVCRLLLDAILNQRERGLHSMKKAA